MFEACLPFWPSVTSIGGYIWAAVIVPWGDPDQSLLFWYLFIFLLGALAVKAGLRLRSRYRDDSPEWH